MENWSPKLLSATKRWRKAVHTVIDTPLVWCQKLSNNWKKFPKFTFHNELLISIKMILSCFTKVIHVVSSNYLFSLTCFEKYGSSFGSKAIIMIHAEGIEFSNLFACKFNMKWLDSSLNKTFKKNWFGLIRSSFLTT